MQTHDQQRHAHVDHLRRLQIEKPEQRAGVHEICQSWENSGLQAPSPKAPERAPACSRSSQCCRGACLRFQRVYPSALVCAETTLRLLYAAQANPADGEHSQKRSRAQMPACVDLYM